MSATREELLGLIDISIKEITVPSNIPVWGGKQLFIKQLTRGQQDAYLNRRLSSAQLKQDVKHKQQNISGMSLYGHDAWLVTKAACDQDGKLLFSDSDVAKLNEKSGEAIGWIAKEIVLFSGMGDDVPVEEEVKN